MKCIPQTVCLLVLSILANVAVAEEFDRAAELKKMEGRFERFFQNMAGTTFRVVKEVAGDQSTVTTYDDVGNVIEAHNSTIKVEKRGPVRVLSFFNVLVTAGPNKGHTQLATSSYIYRIDGDSITECWGLLDEDTSPVRAFQWRRIKDEQK